MRLSPDPKRVVLAWPARKNAAENPFQQLMSDAMAASGWDVREFTVARALTVRRAIWHWHWVDSQLSGQRRVADLFRFVLLRALLLWGRLLGCHLVVTAHNLGPHDIAVDGLVSRWIRSLDSATAAVHYLSESSRAQIGAARPALAGKPYVVTRHGHYRSILPVPLPDKLSAREKLGISGSAKVFVTFGKLRRYKGPVQLLETFVGAELEGVHLIVAGQPETGEVAERLRAWPDTDGLTLIMGLLSHEDLATTVCAADIVLLPYRNILNSGSAIFALSVDRPVVAPAIGSLLELRDQVGEKWMSTYDGDLTDDVLACAARLEPPEESIDLSEFDWAIVAQRLGELYEGLR